MSQKVSNCPHVTCTGNLTWETIHKKKQTQDECDNCDARGPNLWLCMNDSCLYVGCGESSIDHSSSHATEKDHCLTLNMTTFRIWCYSCECEVYRDGNEPPLLVGTKSVTLSGISSERPVPPTVTPPRCPTPTHEDSESESDDDETLKPRGLTGLQNIGNTCYMNSAIQSLSNCPPLTRFFLDCAGYVRTDKKPFLSKAYLKLMTEIWHKKRPSYAVPSTVAHGIKLVHPMFRGYTQQDAQEFLRCFMDQIHEELKTPITDEEIATCPLSPEGDTAESADSSDEEDHKEEINSTIRTSPQHKPKTYLKIVSEPEKTEPGKSELGKTGPEKTEPSDGEYETCDSGLSSERNSAEPSISSGDENNGETESNAANTGTKDVENSSPPPTEKPEPVEKAESSESLLSGKTSDSGIGSSASSTIVSSSCSNVSFSSDITEISSQPSAQSKNNKELANMQQQQKSENSTARNAVNPSETEPEIADAISEGDGQNSSSQSKRSRCFSDSKPRSRANSERNRPQPFSKSNKKKPAQYQSVISDIFDGRLLSSVQCLTCERVSATRETFQDLSLPIPGKDYLHMLHHPRGSAAAAANTSHAQKGSCGEVHLNQGWLSWLFGWMKSWFWGPTITLSDCLATFFSADELKGDNMYSCEKCKKLRNGMKYSKVLTLPEILCIHFKRFRHEFMFSTKINSYVSFPLEGLDMGPYLHKNCKDQITMYDLVSVICHHGTAGGGHYTAYGQNYVTAQWYEFDDQYVTEVDLQQVENCEAYVLFYRKRTDHMIPVRQKAEQIMEVPENTFMRFFISKQWINKFNTFAEPGPITNSDFLCHHGGVHPHKWPFVNDLIQEVPQKLWEFLHDRFGGGPAVNRLYLCDDCQLELDKLKTRQRTEMDTFVKLHDEFQNEEYCGKIYAISMAWFKEWESFVRAKTNDPPGPVDNSKICVVRSGQAALRMNSDYGQLSEEMWTLLYEIYGGGPQLLLKQNRPPSPTVITHRTQDGEPTTTVTT